MQTRILYIDDEIENHKLFGRFARKIPNIQTIFCQGISEITELEELLTNIDIIIADRNMPSIKGPEILHHAKNNDLNITTVITSAYVSIIDANSYEDYIDLHLERPISKKAIENMIAQAKK